MDKKPDRQVAFAVMLTRLAMFGGGVAAMSALWLLASGSWRSMGALISAGSLVGAASLMAVAMWLGEIGRNRLGNAACVLVILLLLFSLSVEEILYGREY